MPQYFAEVLMRIYTKDERFHGLIQAAYRHILKDLVSADTPVQVVAAEHEESGGDGFDPAVLEPVTTATTMTMEGEGDDIDLPPIQVFRPSTPTPRPFVRHASTSALGVGQPGERGRTMGRTASFSDNQFTAVAPNFRGESPSRKPRGKRVVSDVTSERPGKTVKLSDKGGY